MLSAILQRTGNGGGGSSPGGFKRALPLYPSPSQLPILSLKCNRKWDE